MKRRNSHIKELIDCRSIYGWYGCLFSPIKAVVKIIYDKKTRLNFEYPY